MHCHLHGSFINRYHGFSSPVAYVVDEPRSIGVLPMQIDTWNRDKMNISGETIPSLVPPPSPSSPPLPLDPI